MSETTQDPIRLRYGKEDSQFADLYPAPDPAEAPTVVVIHGGFWRSHRTLEMTAPVAEWLARNGWNAWNIEYRRMGETDWRQTLMDVAAAIDYLEKITEPAPLDPTRVVGLGHSAGGQLAVWLAGRRAVASRARTAQPRVPLAAAISLAGVLDFERAVATRIGEDAVREWVGVGAEALRVRYRIADPVKRLPIGTPVRCLHSREDERVPFEQSERYVAAARSAGDDAQLIEIPGAHGDAIDPSAPAWERVVEALRLVDPVGVA